MADKKISQLTAKGSAIAANDLIEASIYISPGVYSTRSVRGDELGGVSAFTELTDVPASYTGQTLKFVRVNAGETALEFATVSVSDTNIATNNLTLPTGTRKLIWGGASSTDILAFRNSTDTVNIAEFRGNGDILLGLDATGTSVLNAPIISIGQSAKASMRGVSIGHFAGANQDTGDRRNVYIGNSVARLGANETNYYNVGIGAECLYRITSGYQNVCSGFSSGSNMSSGYNNVLNGFNSGIDITTGFANTHVGRSSGGGNATGSGNTQIGAFSGQTAGLNKSLTTSLGVRLRTIHNGAIMIGASIDVNTDADSLTDDSAQFNFRSTSQSLFFNKNTNLVLNSQINLVAGTHFEIAATNTQTVHNGTAPITNIANAYQQYSADITAGNAAPHFRTENGSVVKLYQETTGIAAATLVGNAGTNITDTDTFDGYTLKQVVKALRNLGILA